MSEQKTDPISLPSLDEPAGKIEIQIWENDEIGLQLTNIDVLGAMIVFGHVIQRLMQDYKNDQDMANVFKSAFPTQ